MENRYNALRLNPADNVAVALRNIGIGEKVVIQGLDEEIVAIKGIAYGHKVSLSVIGNGEEIIKYGECMGISTEDIPLGTHVHVSNVRGLNERERMNIISKLLQTQ